MLVRVEFDDGDALVGAVRLHLAELTSRQRVQAAHAAGGLRALARATERELVERRLPEPLSSALGRAGPDDALREIERAASRGVRVLVAGDAALPSGLGDLPDPPQALWVRGTPGGDEALSMAIVGARRPTAYGLAVTRRLASDLARAGVVVVSGGARGIDGEAHDAVLASRGRTVAVLGCGVDVAYPLEHRSLFARIADEGGAIVSEHPLGTRPRRHHFPVRNRLLAAWARAVIVTEATFQSGSLITARLALDLGRDVLAVPGPVTSKASEGTNDLIATGARLLRGLADVVDELRHDERGRLALAADGSPAAPAEPLLEAMEPGTPVPLDGLAERAGLGAGELLGRLVRLEAAGLVRSLAGGLWQRS